MKKLILIAACALCALTASAKGDSADYHSIRAGASIFKYYGGGTSCDFSYGYDAGYCYGLAVYKDNVYCEFGASIVQKGASSTSSYGTTKSTPTYIEISARVPAMIHFTKGFAGQIDAGVFYDYGIFGYTKSVYKGGSDRSKYFDSSSTRKSDFGVSFGLGFTFAKRIYFGAHYDLGLLAISKGGETKNMGICVNLGVNF